MNLIPYMPPSIYGNAGSLTILEQDLYVKPLARALAEHPDLWNQNPDRTASPDSPHHGVDDIWARYAHPDDNRAAPHLSVWYPAAQVLPIQQMAREVMARVGGEVLGGILITRIPPGGRVRPHTDDGWHAGYYDKFAVQVAAAPGQTFCFEDGAHDTPTGSLYHFRNDRLHWVRNPTEHERVTAIFCIKVISE